MTVEPPLDDRSRNLLSIAGFASLIGALVVAHTNPAAEYELSIYAATPLAFWVGVVIAFSVALYLAFWVDGGRYRILGVSLGGMSSFAVVSLPILRGYYFHGVHDAVTHVGWARELATGAQLPFDLLYPGIHTLGAFIAELTGYTVWQSMLFVPALVILAFFVFTPLVVREIIDGSLAAAVGAFSAFLLIPVHLIANTTSAHPSSQTIFFTPVVLYLLIRYLRSSGTTGRFGVFTAVGVALSLTTVAAIIYHPQQALNVIILFGVIGLIQLGADRISDLSWRNHRQMYSITGLSAIAYLGWVFHSPTVISTAQGAFQSVLGYLTGSAPAPGSSVASQTTALTAIDANLPVTFLKLFAVSTVFAVLTVIVLLGAFGNRFRESELKVDTTNLLTYLGSALATMFTVVLIYFLGDVAVHYFRQAGFMIMMGTILGAVGISYGSMVVRKRGHGTAVRAALVGGFAVMILLSTLVVFNSPYIHKANQHVTESKVDGYETTFEFTNDSAWMAGIRQEPQRYWDGIVGTDDNGRRDGNVNSTEIHRLQQQRDTDWYLTVHTNTYERETIAYQGYRYSADDLGAIERQVGVNRVHANGDFRLFYVSSGE